MFNGSLIMADDRSTSLPNNEINTFGKKTENIVLHYNFTTMQFHLFAKTKIS